MEWTFEVLGRGVERDGGDELVEVADEDEGGEEWEIAGSGLGCNGGIREIDKTWRYETDTWVGDWSVDDGKMEE